MHKITINPAELQRWRAVEKVTPDERPTRFSPIDFRRTALVVIDMQVFFTVPGCRNHLAASAGIIPNINRLARRLREVGGKVIWVQQTFRPDTQFDIPAWRTKVFPNQTRILNEFLAKGAPQYQLHEDMETVPGDIFVDKTRWGAMGPQSSELDAVLKANDILTVIVTGVASDACVETTVRQAAMMDYQSIFVMDGTATENDEFHNGAIKNLNHLHIIDLLMTDDLVAEMDRASGRR